MSIQCTHERHILKKAPKQVKLQWQTHTISSTVSTWLLAIVTQPKIMLDLLNLLNSSRSLRRCASSIETAQRMIHVHKQLHLHVCMSFTLLASKMVMAYDAEIFHHCGQFHWNTTCKINSTHMTSYVFNVITYCNASPFDLSVHSLASKPAASSLSAMVMYASLSALR